MYQDMPSSMWYHLYTIVCYNKLIPDTYTGITRSLYLIEYHHRECSQDGQSYLYKFIRSNGGWDNWYLTHQTTHDTYEEAKFTKVLGSLNIYEPLISVPTIYKIYCRDRSILETYVGQTINFDSRRDSHFVASLYKQLKLYDFIRDNGGWSNWKMERIQEYPNCKDKTELDRLEWYWWKHLDSKLNSISPGNQQDLKRHKNLLYEKMQQYEQMVFNNIEPRNEFFGRTISLEI